MVDGQLGTAENERNDDGSHEGEDHDRGEDGGEFNQRVNPASEDDQSDGDQNVFGDVDVNE